MSIAELPLQTKLMTAAEFWALPDDGTERDLIDGVVRVWGSKVTARNKSHSQIEARITQLLRNWLDSRPAKSGLIVSGEAGFRLRLTRDSLVGIDVAYASAEVVAATPRESPFFDGPPVLAVEILSPSDKLEQIVAKVQKYLEAGAVAWVVSPDFVTVSVHRPGQLVETLNASQELDGDPYLPGFRVSVATLFS